MAGAIFVTFVFFSFTPLSFKHWEWFIYGWVFEIWREYFDFSWDVADFHKGMRKGDQFMFCEFPHGIFPMGQIVSTSVIPEVTADKMICGTGADVIFKVPGMRQFMSWCGVHPVKRNTISKIIKGGKHVAIIPGGIAEMFLISDDKEEIYLKKRTNTMKAAITEGIHLVPTFFFGNSRVLKPVGQGSDSWVSKMSRKMRTSLVLFYGRWGTPVPFRHPLRMVMGEPVRVTQCDNPTDEQAHELLNRLQEAVKKLYDEKKPLWETRPLVIS